MENLFKSVQKQVLFIDTEVEIKLPDYPFRFTQALVHRCLHYCTVQIHPMEHRVLLFTNNLQASLHLHPDHRRFGRRNWHTLADVIRGRLIFLPDVVLLLTDDIFPGPLQMPFVFLRSKTTFNFVAISMTRSEKWSTMISSCQEAWFWPLIKPWLVCQQIGSHGDPGGCVISTYE